MGECEGRKSERGGGTKVGDGGGMELEEGRGSAGPEGRDDGEWNRTGRRSDGIGKADRE